MSRIFKRRDPIRITEAAHAESGDVALAQAVRALRERHGQRVQVQALAARLGPELVAPTTLGTAVQSGHLMLKLGMLGAAALGAGMIAYVASFASSTRPIQEAATERSSVAAAVSSHQAVVESAASAPSKAEQDTVRAAAPRKRESGKPAGTHRAQSSHRVELAPEAELLLLQRAQTLALSKPRAALSVLAEHAHAYPRGVFAQEREVLALEAEMRLGLRVDARARAERFLASYPRSAHARRVRVLLEPDPR